MHIIPSDQLKHAKHSFSEKAYHRVLDLCEQELLCRPDNREAKKLRKRAQDILANRDVKRGMVFICLSVLAVLLLVFSLHRRVVQELHVKALQVNSLIDDVGFLREENALLRDMVSSAQLVRRPMRRSPVQLPKAVYPDVFLEVSKETDEDPIFQRTLDILLLGIHEKLTDTILLLSIDPGTERISLLSIPRDFSMNGRRINEVYSRYGIEKMKRDIKEVTGILPDRYAILDFATFTKAIDALGGVSIDVPEDLVDPFFPVSDTRYEVFSVTKGLQHFDGTTALRYARSRKTTSDFDRARRQQELLVAVRDRMKELNLWNDRKILTEFFTAFLPNIATDINVLEAVQYVRNYKDFMVQSGNVLSTANYLSALANEVGMYMVAPRQGRYDEIREYVRGLVEGEAL